MSCRRGLYKMYSVFGTLTTAWTLVLETESSAYAIFREECMKFRDIVSLRTRFVVFLWVGIYWNSSYNNVSFF